MSTHNLVVLVKCTRNNYRPRDVYARYVNDESGNQDEFWVASFQQIMALESCIAIDGEPNCFVVNRRLVTNSFKCKGNVMMRQSFLALLAGMGR